jgi:DNA-directed RNA polymerase II subunit RPB9
MDILCTLNQRGEKPDLQIFVVAVITMETGTTGDEAKIVRLRFCPETNDLLYPKPIDGKLTFVCNSSQYVEEPAPNEWCVYRRVVKHTVKDKAVVLTDVRSDPTLPRETNVTCPKCGEHEAVIFCSSSERGMTLFLNCVFCAHRWKEAV